ncbi:unnamed protein product [Ixodes pacificus]
MGTSINPCDSLIGYVCSRWKKVHPEISTPFRFVEKEVVIPLQRDLLRMIVNPLQTSAMEKVTAAVQNCYVIRRNRLENLQALSEFLANNGFQLPPVSGQPVPSPLELLITLNFRLRIPLLFALRPAIDLRTDDRKILTVMTDMYNLERFAFVSINSK